MRLIGRLHPRSAGARGALALSLVLLAAALGATAALAASSAGSDDGGAGSTDAAMIACAKKVAPAAEFEAFQKTGDPIKFSASTKAALAKQCGISFGGSSGGGSNGGSGQAGDCGGPGSQCGGGGGADGSGGSGAGGSERFNTTQLACIKKVVTAAEYAAILKTSSAAGLRKATQQKVLLKCAGAGTGGSGGISLAKAKTGAFLTISPIDPAQVTGISVFRSCAGHDYSGPNLQGQVETDRSMKHYILTAIPWEPADQLQGVAPFAGTVRVVTEQFPLGKQLQLVGVDTGWTLILFHADPLVANGATVKAGQPIAAWPPKGAVKTFADQGKEASGGMSFDIAFQTNQGALDSFLSHLAPAAAKAWTAKGYTPARSIVSKAKRDAAPCNGTYDGDQSAGNYISARG